MNAGMFHGLQEQVRLATQSGPSWSEGGRIHSAFKPNSDSRLARNGVGIPSLGQAIFVISEDPVNFHEFARLFRDVLRCPDALYLDGNISSLWASAIGRRDSHNKLGPIIAVTEVER